MDVNEHETLSSIYKYPTKCDGLVQSGNHYHLNVTCSCHDIAEVKSIADPQARGHFTLILGYELCS
jgi:hypothetical protein